MKLSYSIGKTVNLGNYESMRIDIGFEIDTDKDKETYEDMREKTDLELHDREMVALKKRR